MSRASDCSGCAYGNHDRHDRDWNITPGLIGGEYCACSGDCAERSAAQAEALVRFWFPSAGAKP